MTFEPLVDSVSEDAGVIEAFKVVKRGKTEKTVTISLFLLVAPASEFEFNRTTMCYSDRSCTIILNLDVSLLVIRKVSEYKDILPMDEVKLKFAYNMTVYSANVYC